MLYLGFAAAAAAAALSAFEVPGLLEAEPRLPKRLVGLGATILAFGRAAIAGAALGSWPASCGRLAEEPFAVVPGFGGFLVFGLTTTRLEAGCPLLSPSRGRFDPATSARGPLVAAASGAGLFPGEPSLEPCFRFEDEAALSWIFLARSLTIWPPFFRNLGNNLATFVFWRTSSSTVVKWESSWIGCFLAFLLLQVSLLYKLP